MTYSDLTPRQRELMGMLRREGKTMEITTVGMPTPMINEWLALSGNGLIRWRGFVSGTTLDHPDNAWGVTLTLAGETMMIAEGL